MRWLFIFFIIVLDLFANELIHNYNHVKMNVSLRVGAPEVVRKELLNFAEEKNGYLKRFTNDRIIIVFPNKITKDQILNYLKNKGIIITQNFSTLDYSDKILTLNTTIKVKEQYLNQLNQLIQEANLTQTLEMEKEISKVITELEELKGDYQYYLELASTIEVEIQFLSFEQRNLPSTPYPGWISKLGIYNFLERFHEK
ncbi:MAG: hypothetical protein KatS3mg129_1182 [Leptospiraceae bacterium]|nr:MAG: hypothetical protein KatS3mg129_1182 [Leptospiraceae bacterium]